MGGARPHIEQGRCGRRGPGGYPAGVRRVPLAFVLVGVLGLLAAGGAVLGAFQAPTGTDAAVHNGASDTLLSTHVAGSYTTSQFSGLVISFDFRPDHASEVAHGPNGKIEGNRTLLGAQASSVLGPVHRLLSLTHFASNGSHYVSTQPASVLVRPSTRPKVTGTYRTRVQLDTGYVVAILIHIDAKEAGRRISESFDYRLTRVGSWTRPA